MGVSHGVQYAPESHPFLPFHELGAGPPSAAVGLPAAAGPAPHRQPHHPEAGTRRVLARRILRAVLAFEGGRGRLGGASLLAAGGGRGREVAQDDAASRLVGSLFEI